MTDKLSDATKKLSDATKKLSDATKKLKTPFYNFICVLNIKMDTRLLSIIGLLLVIFIGAMLGNSGVVGYSSAKSLKEYPYEGFEQIQEDLTLIYPNPTNGLVHIEIPNQTIQSIKVYDLQGQLIKETTECQFDLSNFSNGTYFLKAQTKQRFYSYKLLKQ